jgi:CRP-like cAMP-binding protein
VKMRYVGNAPFFSALSEQEQERVSERMHLEHRRNGETLFHKGNDSTALYLVKSGWVRLISDGGAALANQGPGSLVGETDLFLDRLRSVGAILTTDAELWVLGKEDLLDLIAEAPRIGLKLTLAFGSRLSLFDRYLVEHRLKTLSFLSDLGQETLEAIAHRLVLLEKKNGEFIVEGGQPPEALFVVESGLVHLDSSEEGGDFSELGPGETFGELAVITGKPHTRSAQAAGDVVLWALPSAEFEALAGEYPDVRLALSRTIREPLLPEDQSRAVERLIVMPIFAGLQEDVLWAVAERLLLRHVPAGEFVFADGSPGDAFYLIDSGQVEIVSDGRKGHTVLARLGPDEFFGEMSLLTGKPRSTAARTATHTNLWVLYRSDFDDLVNRHPSISLALSKVLSERLAEMDRRFTESHLRGLKLLASLSPSQLEDVSRRLIPVRFRQGEVIIHEGEPGEEMFFMESGRVRVVRKRGSRMVLLAELGGGDLFGEMALLTGSPRSATVTALSDVNLWSMPQADFDDLVTAYPNLALALSRVLSDRLRNTDERYLQQPAEPVTEPAAKRRPAPRPRRAAKPRPAPQPSRAARPAAAEQPTVIARRPATPAPKARPARRKPARSLTSELGKTFSGTAAWFGALSPGAKVRLVLVTMLLAWLAFIAAPALVISTLAADNVTNLQGAIAFVQEVTPPPSEAPLPTETPMPAAVMLESPAESAVEPNVRTPIEAPIEAPVEAPVEVTASPADALEPAASLSEPATPTPWIVVITNTPPPVTDTPVPPTATPVPPTATAKPKPAMAAAPPPTATAATRKQPARSLDSRLQSLNVVLEPAGVKAGQSYWRLVDVRWENEQEAGGGHSIFVNVLDEGGNRLVGQPVDVRWPSGSLTVITEDKPPNEYSANFPMYNCLGSYAVSVPGLPSDTIVGLGLGTAAQPNFKVHTNFLLTFQRVTY